MKSTLRQLALVTVGLAAWSSVSVNADIAIQPEKARQTLPEIVSPAAGETSVPIDTRLQLTFDREPVLDDRGAVRIYRTRDGALVDSITVAGDTDTLGYPGQERVRVLNTHPIRIDGNTATIAPHNGALDYNTQYRVTVDAGVFQDAVLDKNAGWTFTTKAAPPPGPNLTVSGTREADFRTIQGALNFAMEHQSRDQPVTIDIDQGTYYEPLYLRGKDNVTLRGKSRIGTLIRYRNSEKINGGTGGSQPRNTEAPSGGRSLFLVEDVDRLTVQDLTLENTILRSDPEGGQAETLYFNSDQGRLVAQNAAFISEQDTLLLKGYSWFYHTLVAGNVDFIWGYVQAALFEKSEIRSLGDSTSDSKGGYVLQARAAENAKGFVFLDSRLTHGPGPAGNDVPAGASYLARSSGRAIYFDHIAFINCAMGGHIADIGWAGEGVNNQPAPNPASANAAAGWREYGSTDLDGQPLDLSRRESAHILTEQEYRNAFATRQQVFADFDNGQGWNPQPASSP